MEFHAREDLLALLPRIIGKSSRATKVYRDIKKISSKDTPVLISGERGSHKDLVALAIHARSRRLEGPFVAVNLATIPEESMEIELFGSGKEGSIASGNGVCKIEEAKDGTLLLDEISMMEKDLQERFLEFLGGKEQRASGVRVICTTSEPLKKNVKNGLFRKDLHEVLDSAHIRIPALRERREDIVPLAVFLLKKTVERFETCPKELSRDAKEFLLKYNWPGDTMELEEMVKRTVLLSRGNVIEKKDFLLGDIRSCSIREFLELKLKRYLSEMTQLDNCNLYSTVLCEAEKALIGIVLRETGGNQLKAAKTLGINRNTLRAKIKEYRIRL